MSDVEANCLPQRGPLFQSEPKRPREVQVPAVASDQIVWPWQLKRALTFNLKAKAAR